MKEKEHFIVTEHRDMSVNALEAVAASGIPVEKTPHVGNWRIDNMMWLTENILNIAFDRTTGSKDKNFHPHGIIHGGKFESIADREKMTTHTGMSGVHTNTIRNIIPNARLDTYAEYLRKHEDLINDLLNAVGEESIRMGLWYRRVTDMGVIIKATPRSWSEVKGEGIFGINRQDSGWIFPNVLNVILIAMADSIRNNSIDIVHHVSGPDMYRYIGKMHNDLQQLYGFALSKIGELPETLHYNLHVGGSINRFGGTKGEQYARVSDVVDKMQPLLDIAKEKGLVAKSAKERGENPRDAIQQIMAREKGYFNALKEALRETMEVFFYDINKPEYTSQYDAQAAGGFEKHPFGIESTILELEAAGELLLKVKKSIEGDERYGRR